MGQLLGNAIHSTNGYENSTPITEVAKNTRLTVAALDKLNCNTAQLFNTNEQFVLLGTATITLLANTYHSYSFVIISGTVDITESGITLSDAGVGYFGNVEATTLLSNSVTFVGQEVGTKVVIKTIR